MLIYRRDPDKIELNHLLEFAALDDARILEIGCGEGQLTFLYSDLPSLVIGIDQDSDALENGTNTARNSGQTHVSFLQGSGAQLPLPAQQFDTVIFSSSL